MRVEQLGEGTPEIAIVAAIHGDEPCGVRSIETLLDASPAVKQPVKLIITNEPALDRDERFIDADLNRVFPGDPDAEEYERRLAAALLDEVRGCTALALHSTQSTPRPFAIASEIGPLIERIGPHLSIDALVEAGSCVGTALGGYVDAIEIECGRQGTAQASENAERLVSEFLAVTGAIPASDSPARALPVYRLREQIPKPRGAAYEILVQNFEPVAEGTPYATIDDEPQRAQEPFYPVLMSAHGYEQQFGYAADMIDRIEPRQLLTKPERAPTHAGIPEATR